MLLKSMLSSKIGQFNALQNIFPSFRRINFLIPCCADVYAFFCFPIFFQELPCVRYRAAKADDVCTATKLRDSIPTKLASAVWNCVSKYKSTVPNFPQTETCDLLILDRSIDQVTTNTPVYPENFLSV